MPEQRSFRPYTRPKDGPRRPMLGYTLGAWWFNVSHLPGSIMRRLMRPILRALNPSPGVVRPWWTGLLALAIVFAAVTGVAALVMFRPKVVISPQGVNHVAVGTELTGWKLESLNQPGAFSTPAQTNGKVTVIHYWRLGHKSSLATLPKIAQLHQRQRGSNQYATLTLVSQPVDAGEAETGTDEARHSAQRRRVMDLLSERNIDLPVFEDEGDKLTGALEAAGAFHGRYPTTVVLNKEGKVEGVWNEYPIGHIEQISALVQYLTTH